MLAAGLTIATLIIVGTFAMSKAAGKDKYKDEWIIQRKKEKKQIDINFKGHLQCDDDCYMCDEQGICELSEMQK